MSPSKQNEWLVIFYSVPSRPVANRMKLWRKLAKIGAVPLKGAVYILPATEEHEELFQWLIGEVKSMGGDGAFIRSAEIKTMDEADIRELFLQQSGQEYGNLEKKIDVLERKVQSIRKGTKGEEKAVLSDLLSKMTKELDEITKRDFFSSPSGAAMKKRFQAIESSLKGMGRTAPEEAASIRMRQRADYQGRIWVSRKHPFVDRMASAWLIKRFIDPKAAFRFIDERELSGIGDKAVAFDVRGGEFTHAGDFCTFEVLIRSFSIRDRAVRKIAELVHDLDVKDEKYGKPETSGVEEILSGIRKTATSDDDALERGMAVFEMLYQSKST
jgi:hypothetical protein